MSDLCTPRWRELAESLGGIPCEGANPVGYLNDPRHLADWTMPVVELLVVVGAVLAFAHAWRHFRHHGDATKLGVCVAAVAYVLVLEPPLYFPAAFGIDGYVPAVFVHNEFTVGFLYDRMPLYILLIYPCLAYLAWVLVQRLGVRRRHPGLLASLVAAVVLGAVHQAIYSIFDQFGPQHLWWAWDYDVPMTRARIASVPLSSTVNFALVMPTAFALLCFLILARRPRPTVRSIVLPGLLCGALTPLVSMPGQLPVTYLSLVDHPHTTVVVVVMVGMLLGASALLVRELVAARRAPEPVEDGLLGAYPTAYAGLWLTVFAVLWLVALPETLAAGDGLTSRGTPVGSPGYVAACFVLAVGIVVACRPGVRAEARADSAVRVP